MKISKNWLGEYIDIAGIAVNELADMLTFAGVEVEGVHCQGTDSPTVVVAQVMEAAPHPQADRLKVCQVNVGDGEPLRQIVCGAQNYKVGDKVPCALPSTVLPNGMEIKVGKLRGVDSCGMLCSASELGLADKEHGLWILPNDYVIGTPIRDLVLADTMLEIEVTPNRPDQLSHWGMARELAGISGRTLNQDPGEGAPTTQPADGQVQLHAPTLCPYYTATRITGVKVAPSPEWLQSKLVSIGLRPINNLVDITNYVLHELGHPLHAFDAAKVSDGLVIRTASDGEAFLALDGVTYSLQADDLLISDERGTPLCLAGVMGGLDSGVTESTTEIILESAWFAPSSVRATSRRLGLSSDSSYRFERGASGWNVLRAATRAIQLITDLCGGHAQATMVAGADPAVPPLVAVTQTQIDQMSGGCISDQEANQILTNLGLRSQGNDKWLTPPWRIDLHRPADLLEEIVRVYGLGRIPARMQGIYADESGFDRTYDFQMKLRRTLSTLGFWETQTIKLIASSSLDDTIAQVRDAMPVKPLMEGDLIKVSLPLSEDHAVMRPAQTPGLIAAAVRNKNHGVEMLRFFECGRVFRHTGGGKGRDIESDTLGFLLSGPTMPESWSSGKPAVATWADLVAVIEALVHGRKVTVLPARDRDNATLGADVAVNGRPIGYMAQVSLARCRELGLNHAVYVAELDVRKLQEVMTAAVRAQELSLFPGSVRDAALEVPMSVSNAAIEKAIDSAKEKLLVSFRCFDRFEDSTGEKMSLDRKSLAYTFLYRAADRTLVAQEVDDAHARVLAVLSKQIKDLTKR